MMYFPTKMRSVLEPQNPQNHRVVFCWTILRNLRLDLFSHPKLAGARNGAFLEDRSNPEPK